MTHYERLYLILRPALGNAGGHVRLEQRGNRAQMSLFVHGLEGRQKLRVLIFSHLDADPAVVDLGTLVTGEKGQGNLTCTGIRLPGSASLSDCHTLAVCQDWPLNQLIMAAAIGSHAPGSRWALQAAIDHYLSVPVKAPEPEDAALSLAPSPSLDAVPPPNVLSIEKDPPPQPLDASAPPPALDALRPLQWPQSLTELKTYFDLLPPCAPFDAPGWRFVRAPLPQGGPGPVCYIGVRAINGRIRQAAYALPAVGASPPNGLEAYRHEIGRHQKAYWVLRQDH